MRLAKITAIVILALILAVPAMAGVTETRIKSNIYEITWSWTAGALGAVTSETWPIDGLVILAESNPGSVSPTANYEIFVADEDGADVFGDTGTAASPGSDGSLANRSQTVSQRAMPLVNNVYSATIVGGSVTFYIINNSTVGATGTLKIYVLR